MLFNATVSIILLFRCDPFLFVEEAGVSAENHRHLVGKKLTTSVLKNQSKKVNNLFSLLYTIVSCIVWAIHFNFCYILLHFLDQWFINFSNSFFPIVRYTCKAKRYYIILSASSSGNRRRSLSYNKRRNKCCTEWYYWGKNRKLNTKMFC